MESAPMTIAVFLFSSAHAAVITKYTDWPLVVCLTLFVLISR